jgi:predicted metal-dependent peptidase
MQVMQITPLSAKEEKDIENNLSRCRVQMLMNFPFFGILALHLEMEQDYTVGTAATDGKKFYYSPHFIKKLTEAERNWTIIHEVLHPALKHLWRKGSREHKKFNYACDYAIHSIMHQFLDEIPGSNYGQSNNLKAKLSMPKGCLYDKKYDDMTAEQIYDLLPDDFDKGEKGNDGGDGSDGDGGQTPFDNHSKWEDAKTQEGGQAKAADWEGRMVSAAKAAEGKAAGNIPGFLKRMLGKITKPQKDWKTLLHEFIQVETCDYSFNPPDRRFSESDFFLPDFNDTNETVKDIQFWIDTSGSIGDKEMSVAYSELVGAINQFEGKLSGSLGFFDHATYGPYDFGSVEDVAKIRPEGGGGTSFHVIFNKIKELQEKEDKEIAGIIILTDGYADWPKESIAQGIPVLWLINNEQVTPPWGLHTTIKV